APRRAARRPLPAQVLSVVRRAPRPRARPREAPPGGAAAHRRRRRGEGRPRAAAGGGPRSRVGGGPLPRTQTATRRPTRTHRLLLMAGMVLVGFNLRPVVTSLGPELGDVRDALGLSGAAQGLL